MLGVNLPGFNGATSFQKWIVEPNGWYALPETVFQWGHFFSEMDSAFFWYTLTPQDNVSMGPLLFRNG